MLYHRNSLCTNYIVFEEDALILSRYMVQLLLSLSLFRTRRSRNTQAKRTYTQNGRALFARSVREIYHTDPYRGTLVYTKVYALNSNVEESSHRSKLNNDDETSFFALSTLQLSSFEAASADKTLSCIRI